MINPSANGWIDKYFMEHNLLFHSAPISSFSIYKNIRKTGFIYGHIISINTNSKIDISQWKSDEISKVALLTSLFEMYLFTTKQSNNEEFIENMIAFYKEMAPSNFDFLKKIITTSPSSKLESLINDRVQTNKDIISKNFSHIVTNALLFVDVLAFQQYLQKGKIPEKYLIRMEETIMSIVSLALKVKTVQSHYDDLLIKLFEASVRYTKFSKISIQNLEELPLDYFSNDLEVLSSLMATFSDSFEDK